MVWFGLVRFGLVVRAGLAFDLIKSARLVACYHFFFIYGFDLPFTAIICVFSWVCKDVDVVVSMLDMQ